MLHSAVPTSSFTAEPALIGSRLQNVAAKKEGSTPVWNVHEWSVK